MVLPKTAMPLPFDAHLQRLRTASGPNTWAALQRQAGLSRHALTQLRRGSWASLTLGQLQAVAAALGCSLAALVPDLPGSEDVEALRQECRRLRQELEQQQSGAILDHQRQIFRQIQPLLTNYPTARHMADLRPTLPARNLTALFAPLEKLLADWGYLPIGAAWEQTAFDPQLHQPDEPGLAAGDPVYIRFVGYRCGAEILCPAKVSRTLPGGWP